MLSLQAQHDSKKGFEALPERRYQRVHRHSSLENLEPTSRDRPRSSSLNPFPGHASEECQTTGIPYTVDDDHMMVEFPSALSGHLVKGREKSIIRRDAKLWIFAMDIQLCKSSNENDSSLRKLDEEHGLNEFTPVLIDNYVIAFNNSVGRRLSILQHHFQLKICDFARIAFKGQHSYLVLLSFYPHQGSKFDASSAQDRREQHLLLESLQWLARHLLMRFALGSFYTSLHWIPSCGIYPCKACDAKKRSDRATLEIFRLKQIVESLPSKLQALSRNELAEERRLEEIYMEWKPTRDSLQALPRQILLQVFQHTDSPTVWSLDQTTTWFRYLTRSLVPELQVDLFEHQRVALQWMLSRERHRAGLQRSSAFLPTWTNPLISPVTGDLYFDWMYNRLVKEQSTCYDVRGGLFCDEPGLGKTVTSLALIVRTRRTAPAFPVHTASIEHLGETDADLAAFFTIITERFLYEIENRVRLKPRREHWNKFADFVAAFREDIMHRDNFTRSSEPTTSHIHSRELWRLVTQWMEDHRVLLSEIVGCGALDALRIAFRDLALTQNPFTFDTNEATSLCAEAHQRSESRLRFFVISKKSLYCPGGFIRLVADGIPAASAAASRFIAGDSVSKTTRSTIQRNEVGVSESGVALGEVIQRSPSRRPIRACRTTVQYSSPSFQNRPDRLRSSIESVFDYHVVVCVPTTLIALPENLVSHWTSQVQRHIRGPGVLRFLRFADIRGKSFWELHDADVVFITFNELRGEYAALMNGCSLLSRIYWLRFIIDEGHSIGSLSCTNLQRCCLAILAERRWIMTGTPTPNQTGGSTELQYLFPLFSFLGLEPFVWARRQAFLRCIQRPIERSLGYEGLYVLRKTLQHIMIRSAKEDITCIPQLEIHDEVLSFTTEEADAYNALVSVIKRNLLLADFFDENHKESLLHPANRKSARTALQNLRLCCCVTGHIHFEVIRDELSELLSSLRETLLLESRATLAGPKVPNNELRAVESENDFAPTLSNGDRANLSDIGTDHSLLSGRSKSESLTRSKRCRYAGNSCEAECCNGSFGKSNTPIRDGPEKISESPLSFEDRFQSSLFALDSPAGADLERFQPTSPCLEEDSTRNVKRMTPHDGSDLSSSHLVSIANFREALSTNPGMTDRYGAFVLPEALEYRLGYVEQVLCNRAHALQSSCESCGRLGTQMPIVTPCAHILCLDCAASNRRSCMVCGRNYKLGRHNEPVDLIELQPSFTQDSWVPRWDRKMTSKIARMLKLLEEWSADLVSTESETFCERGRSNEAETNRLAKRRHKVIVYSNFAHHFDVIHYHLSSRNFVFAYYCSRLSPAERRAQIDRFVQDPETWILLMDEKGALGLDLSFVTRIIIMEPVWSRSQEHQIISRAHRIGAKNRITVYRLMMRDSIETDLVDVNAAGVFDAEAYSEEFDARVSLEKNSQGSLKNTLATSSLDHLGGSNKEQEEKLRRNRLLRRLHFVRGEPFSPGTVVSSSVRIL